MYIGNAVKQGIAFFCMLLLIFSSYSSNSFAAETKWLEVSRIDNQFLSIDKNSIKYNNRGFLSVVTKYSEINPEDNEIINSESFLMAIDCEKRLFSKLPVNGNIQQVKNWETSIDNKLIKTSIINSCSN
tara:strand:+ start:14 stop:400 length:387 start_codon:yes stop_codon:yes gene_type:complete